MDNSDLIQSMQEMMAEMAAMRAELNDLKQRAIVVVKPDPPQPVKPVVSTTRRSVLRRLAGGILAGLAVGSVAIAMPEQAEAKFVAANGAGTIVMPPGGTISGSLYSTTIYGLLGTSNTSLLLGNFLPNYKIGVFGFSTSSGANVYGVYGQGGSVGVFGTGSIGVQGTSDAGIGLYASSVSGVPFSIAPNSQLPSTGTRIVGDMYMEPSGNLYIYTIAGWLRVAFA